MPKGYWIGRVDVADTEKYKAYIQANAVAFKKFGAKFLVAPVASRIPKEQAAVET